jgi:hypothetical protein
MQGYPGRVLHVLARLIGLGRARIVDRPGVVAVVDRDVQHRQIDPQVLVRLVAPAAAHRRLVAVVGVVSMQVGVGVEAVADVALRGDAKRRVERRDRSGDHRAIGARPVVARTEFDPSAELIGGRFALDDDQSGERVRPVDRRLRAAQHLDPRDVEQRRGGTESAERDVVEDEPDGGIRCALVLLQLADAANLEVTRPRRVAGPVEVRHQRQHVLEMLFAGRAQGVRAEHGRAAGELDVRHRA